MTNAPKFYLTVYPKKYAHGFRFAVLFCGYTLTDFPISISLNSLALWQSNDCPSASKATLMNMDKYFMWVHYERLHNHNKAKHNKTVCIFLRIYCTSPRWRNCPRWSNYQALNHHQFHAVVEYLLNKCNVLLGFKISLFTILVSLIPSCLTNHQTSNIRHTKSQNLNVSRLVLQLSLPNPMKSGVKSRIKMQLEQRRHVKQRGRDVDKKKVSLVDHQMQRN